ncbi:hypothetical protein Hanom_Chr05g00417061 [Helianthus anomalus]
MECIRPHIVVEANSAQTSIYKQNEENNLQCHNNFLYLTSYNIRGASIYT